MKQKRGGNLDIDVLTVRGVPTGLLEWGTITYTGNTGNVGVEIKLLWSVSVMALGIMRQLMKRQHL